MIKLIAITVDIAGQQYEISRCMDDPVKVTISTVDGVIDIYPAMFYQLECASKFFLANKDIPCTTQQ